MRPSAAGGRGTAWHAELDELPGLGAHPPQVSPTAGSGTRQPRGFPKMTPTRVHKHGARSAVLAVMASFLAFGLSATALPAVAGPKVPAAYSFRKIDNGADPSFNQLLGINNSGRTARTPSKARTSLGRRRLR